MNREQHDILRDHNRDLAVQVIALQKQLLDVQAELIKRNCEMISRNQELMMLRADLREAERFSWIDVVEKGVPVPPGTKRALLLDSKSCLHKAGVDEPVFLLRAQDMMASELVHQWADLAKHNGAPAEKWQGAKRIAEAMHNWPHHKIPD